MADFQLPDSFRLALERSVAQSELPPILKQGMVEIARNVASNEAIRKAVNSRAASGLLSDLLAIAGKSQRFR